MSDKKILILMGSPRKKGNTATLAARLAQGAQSAGADVETVVLADLVVAPCLACDGCRRKDGRCVQEDGMQSLYPKIREADALVFASPVYWFNMSAQIKAVMDRCYAFGAKEYRELAGKRIGVVMSYGAEDPFDSGCVNALRSFQDACSYVGMELTGMVYGSADQPGEIAQNAGLMAKAEALGRNLAEN